MSKVLFIDDETDLLEIYTAHTEDTEHEAIVCKGGKAALTLIENTKYDIVVTDLLMPEVDGGQIIDACRHSKLNNNTPIIVVSGHLVEIFSDRGPSLGMIQLIEKPVTREKLVKMLDDLIKPQEVPTDVQFLEQIVTGTIRTLRLMAEVTIEAEAQHIKKEGEVSGDVSGVITFHSKNKEVSVSLSFKEADYLKILSKILRSDVNSIDKYNEDGAAEFLNIIYGNARHTWDAIGTVTEQAIPSLVMGKKSLC